MKYKYIIIIVLLLILLYIIFFKKEEFIVVGGNTGTTIENTQRSGAAGLSNIESPVTWVDTFQNSKEVKSKITGIFTVENNNLYLSESIWKTPAIQQGPFITDKDANVVYIFNNDNKSQLISYGVPEKCNLLDTTQKTLCNGMISKYDISSVPDVYNTQFIQQVNSNGRKYIMHGPTKLMVTYIFITQEMIDIVNKYPLSQQTPWNYFTLVQTPSIKFVVNTFNKVGDIIPFVFLGNGLEDIFPYNYQVVLDMTISSNKNIPFNESSKIYNVMMNNYSELTSDGRWLIEEVSSMICTSENRTIFDGYSQCKTLIDKYYTNYDFLDSNTRGQIGEKTRCNIQHYLSKAHPEVGLSVANCPEITQDIKTTIKRVYMLTSDGSKLFRMVTKSNIEDGIQDWKFVMPSLSTMNKCKSNELFTNGICSPCQPNQILNSTKTRCTPSCPAGQYYQGNYCNNCPGIVSEDKMTCFVGGKKYLGKVFENRYGEVLMDDGTYITIGDLLTFIAGPKDESMSECFSFIGDIGSALNKGWNYIKQGYNWTKARIEDAASFIKNAAEKVGEWAKTVSSTAINWAKNAGKDILKGLIAIGNALSCVVRKALRAIVDFFEQFAKWAMKIASMIYDFLKDKLEDFWNKILKPIIQRLFQVWTGGQVCDFIQQSELSNQDAINSIKPLLSDAIRPPMMTFVNGSLDALLASTAVLAPVIPIKTVVYPLVTPYLNPQINKLIYLVLDKFSSPILDVSKPILYPVSKVVCSFEAPPQGIDNYLTQQIDISTVTFDTSTEELASELSDDNFIDY